MRGLLKHEGHEDYTKDTKLLARARDLCELGATFVFFVFKLRGRKRIIQL